MYKIIQRIVPAQLKAIQRCAVPAHLLPEFNLKLVPRTFRGDTVLVCLLTNHQASQKEPGEQSWRMWRRWSLWKPQPEKVFDLLCNKEIPVGDSKHSSLDSTAVQSIILSFKMPRMVFKSAKRCLWFLHRIQVSQKSNRLQYLSIPLHRVKILRQICWGWRRNASCTVQDFVFLWKWSERSDEIYPQWTKLHRTCFGARTPIQQLRENVWHFQIFSAIWIPKEFGKILYKQSKKENQEKVVMKRGKFLSITKLITATLSVHQLCCSGQHQCTLRHQKFQKKKNAISLLK